jgi:hypothetical protein
MSNQGGRKLTRIATLIEINKNKKTKKEKKKL